MNESHPTVTELLELVDNDLDGGALEPHLQACLACRVRLSRLRDERGYEAPGEDVISRLRQVSRSLGVAVQDAAAAPISHAAPQAGELWRVGRDSAMLVWVRKEIAATILDVLPVVLDTDMADEQTLLVESDESPLGIGLAVMTALRTHIHRDAFLNPVGQLALSGDVEKLISGNPAVTHPVGAPILDAHDQRIEYRQAVADVASDFSPMIWQEQRQPEPTGQVLATPSEWDAELAAIAAELSVRANGALIHAIQRLEASSPAGPVRSLAKATYLDTAVLIVAADEAGGTLAARDLVAAVAPLLDVDVDAVAVSRPGSGWETILITRADMRPARRASGGEVAWPRVTLEGLDLLDTLHKHFERATVAWEIVEQTDRSLAGPDIAETASSHAREELKRLRLSGGRAHSPKKEIWLNTPEQVVDQVARMVAAASDNDVDRALEQLGLDVDDD